MRYFDYETVAREAKIPPEKMKRLVQLIREEFPKDPLMRELHILRACMAIRDGHITLEDALKPEPSRCHRHEVVRLFGRRVDIQRKTSNRPLKRLHTETAAELDAMLPSILDKAFKGELI